MSPPKQKGCESVEYDYISCCDNVKFMKALPDECVDLTVTSPPYDNLRKYEGFTWDFESVAKGLFRITKQGGVVVWVVADATVNGSETGTSFRQALYFMECGFKLHDTMIYKKDHISFPERNRYSQVFEYMFVFSKGKPKTFNCIRDRKNKWSNGSKHIKGNYRTSDGDIKRHNKQNLLRDFGSRYNVWEISSGCNKTTLDAYAYEHPAMFPEQLAEDHILSWSNEGDVVFDPFLGSGTTAKMAVLNNRHYLGCELSEKYFDIACRRLDEAEQKILHQKSLDGEQIKIGSERR